MKHEYKKLLEAVNTIQDFCDNQGKCRGCLMQDRDNGNCLIERTIWNFETIERKLMEAENE